ncbi:MAG: hypothetical protein GX131_04965 [candidate division WS1 bacterium]|nr:hypothetical protein [candidate division WS1 bacterium]
MKIDYRSALIGATLLMQAIAVYPAFAQDGEGGLTDATQELAVRLGHCRRHKGDAIREAQEAVAQLTGRHSSRDLTYMNSRWLSAFDLTWELGALKTGERFFVRERDGQVTRWDLGSYVPDAVMVPGAASRSEMQFLSRYYPRIALDRMVLSNVSSTMGERVAFYQERLPEHMIATMNWCKFTWAQDSSRLRTIQVQYEPITLDCKALLTADEARTKATNFALGWPGVVKVSARAASLLSPEHARWTLLMSDEAGVQRTAYRLEVQLQTRRDTEGASNNQPAVGTTDAAVFVDACTGACFAPWASAVWPQEAAENHLYLSVRMGAIDREVMCLYEPRLVDDEVYICARYMESLIWQGHYHREGEQFSVSYIGRVWRGQAGQRTLSVDRDAVELRCPPLVIEEEIFLPAEMIELVTGWTLERTAILQTGGTVILVPPDQ